MSVYDFFTKALLHFDGADAATAFTDLRGHTWTAHGNAQLDTADFKFSTASLLLDGTGDWISTPDSTAFTLGSGDWTYDFFFKCNAAGGTFKSLFGHSNSAFTDWSVLIYRDTGNKIVAEYNGSGGTVQSLLQGTTSFTNALNTGWHHCAVVRSGSTVTLYIDGVAEDSDAVSGAMEDSASAVVIGSDNEAGTTPWLGWIDEFRLSNKARWTANFTPPTAPYRVPLASRRMQQMQGGMAGGMHA